MAVLLAASAAGCRGNRDPILGGNGSAVMDAPGPQVTLTIPATTLPGPTAGLPTNSAITAAFTQSMDPATINGTSFRVTGPGGAAVPGGVAYADGIAIFTPAATLAATTTYTATLTIAATNGVGAPLEGDQALPPDPSDYVWSFTTGAGPDLTRPRVTLTVPATTLPGPTTGVAVNAAVTATFTTDMDPATITAASFTLTTPLPGVSPGGTVAYSGSGRTAIFKPSAALADNTTYTATLTTAATDLSGNQLAGNAAPLPAASNYVWTFTTGSSTATAPAITRTFPGNLANGVALNSSVDATFSTAMDPSTLSTATFKVQTTGLPQGQPIPGQVTFNPAAMVATFTPFANLTASTSYTVTITGAADLAGDALAAGPVANPWTFTTGAILAPGSVNLGSASAIGILSTSAITSTGLTVINGNVALQPGTSITGFPPGIVNGIIDVNDAISAQAKLDLLAAYNTAAALPPGTTIAGGADLGALYPLGMPPGTYTSGSTMLVATSLVLDAGGNANAVWVFQIGSALTTNIGANVSLANGAQAKNVFWACALDATVGVGTVFNGNILAGRNVTAATGATIDGRILAGATTAGTVALQDTTVNVPAQVEPHPHQEKVMRFGTSTRLLGLTALALIAGPFARAQETGWYAGADIGRSKARIDDARINSAVLGQGFGSTSIQDNDQDTGFKAFAGYEFNRTFSLEGGYFNIGQFGYKATTVPAGTLNGDIKVQGLNLDPVFSLPITNRFSAFVRAGAIYAQAKDSFSGTGFVQVQDPSPSKSALSYKFGGGLQYDITRTVGMRVEAERYRINDAVGNKGDIDMLLGGPGGPVRPPCAGLRPGGGGVPRRPASSRRRGSPGAGGGAGQGSHPGGTAPSSISSSPSTRRTSARKTRRSSPSSAPTSPATPTPRPSSKATATTWGRANTT